MPRLGSRKSRNGCKQCKAKRVKCDEMLPCSRCVRQGEECSLLTPSPAGSEADASLALPSTCEDWLLDLELMHHYTTVLYSIGAREAVVHLWRDYIPQQALKHPFLMHGLLAFAALHLAYQQPKSSSKYLQLCEKHQSVALQTFRSILSTPTNPERADALFSLAAILAMSSMARSCALSESSPMDIDAIAELFILTRGIRDMIQLSYEHVWSGPMREMLANNQDYPKSTVVHLSPSISSRFEALRHMLSTYGLDEEALGHCQSALTALEEIYKIIAYCAPSADIEIAATSRWQVVVPMQYIKLVQAHNQPALVILAYYAATVTAVRRAWFTENWAEYALRGISEALDDDMQHWIEWPLRQVEETMSELGVRPVGGGRQSSEPSRTLPLR